MSELGDAFAQLLGRQPTDKERQNLYRVRDALKLRTTDSLWLLLMVLERYETLYEKAPARIMDAVRAVTKPARETAEAQAKAAQEETKKALMEAVRHAAVVSAKQATGAQAVKCVSILATAIVAFVVTVGALAFRKGEASRSRSRIGRRRIELRSLCSEDLASLGCETDGRSVGSRTDAADGPASDDRSLSASRRFRLRSAPPPHGPTL